MEQELLACDPSMAEIRTIRALRGPNIHAYMSVLEVELAIGAYDVRSSDTFPGVVERLTALLPGLLTHECSLGRPGGFIERMRSGTYLPHMVEHVALELQGLLGFDVSFGRVRAMDEPATYTLVVAYEEERPARACVEAALRLSLAALHGRPFDIAAELEALHELSDTYRLGPSTAAIVRAARRRRVPVLRLTETSSLVQLGYGVHQRRIQASETSHTSAIAVDLCQEKPLTNMLLRAVGVAVPEGEVASSADHAWEIALQIGLPVVVKPQDGNQGKGVGVGLMQESEVRAAFEVASQFGEVLIERCVEGHDYRLLVINGKLAAAARRDPAQVTGDGVQTVRKLVEELNRDPRRRPGHSSILSRVKLDASAELTLSQQGLTWDDVPDLGRVVRLRQNSNLSTGGTATDVTDEVHPANARTAELAAQILALDVAGIDMVCKDITRPLAEQRGAIVEVNAAPGLRMHLFPSAGLPRDVGTPIMEMLYPNGQSARIPIIAVTGTNGKTTVTRMIAHIYETAHRTVGMTCTEGTYIDGERIMEGDCSGPRSARAVLLHPSVEVAVLETARGGILREGLAFDECAVGVVTNISSDHLGLRGINTVHDLARVKQVVIESVADSGVAVLNADDRLVAEMAAATSAEVIYFSLRENQHIVAAHLAEGGRAVVVSDGVIVLRHGAEDIPLVELERVPCTLGGAIRFQLQNVLAAAAAAWGAGLNPALIARALTTFVGSQSMVPGRFNLLEMAGVQVILDYGHNPAALEALGQAVSALGERRTTMVLGLPGDRRDDDLRASAAATLPYVDAYILHDLEGRRGREPDEVPQLVQRELLDRPCQIAPGEREAIERAWADVAPGERLIVIADVVDESLKVLERLAASRAAEPCEGSRMAYGGTE